jgi:hypothetical protein
VFASVIVVFVDPVFLKENVTCEIYGGTFGKEFITFLHRMDYTQDDVLSNNREQSCTILTL